MPYDADLAQRLRETLAGEPGVTEKKMFGGIAFLLDGHMAVAASGQGDALVRVDPDHTDRLVDTTTAEVAVMRGRPMAGWLRVPLSGLRSAEQLDEWVRISTGYVRSLPPKR